MPPPRMTANPVRPARYRPGKAVAEEHSSSEEDSDADENEEAQVQAQSSRSQQRRPPPKASSFPTNSASKVAANLKNVDLNERKRRAEVEEKERLAYERREQEKREKDAGFVTESESGSGSEESEDEAEEQDDALIQGGDYSRPAKPVQPPSPRVKPPAPAASESDSGSSSGSEEEDSSDASSSSSDHKPKQIRPLFIKKSDRKTNTTSTFSTNPTEYQEAALAARRQEEADALIQQHLERDAAARAAGRRGWDDDAPDDEDRPDDTDGLDPELEHAQWVARELARLKRSRALLEEREAEIAAIEARRNMSASEREAADKAHVEAQLTEKKDRGTANVMQKYHHSGAFFQDDAEAAELKSRNLMGGNYEDQSTLSKEMFKVRDVTKIGKKGRTRHRDLRTDDTGRWGDFLKDGRKFGGGEGMDGDERFRPDRGGPGASGANARPLGEKRTFGFEGRGEEPKRQKVS